MRRIKLSHLPDLTPVADVAWLLLLFFMAVSKFRAPDQHPVDLPFSHYHGCHLGTPHTLQFKVEETGIISVSFPAYSKSALVKTISDLGDCKLSPIPVSLFFSQSYIDFSPATLIAPSNSLTFSKKDSGLDQQEIIDWLEVVHLAKLDIKVAIRGDQNVSYKAIQRLMQALGSQHITRFHLITNLETDPFASI